MNRITFRTWVVITILGLIFALPVFATAPEKPETQVKQATEIVEEKIIKKSQEQKPKTCIEKNNCTVKENPKKCNLDTHWMWSDGSCHKKTVPAVNSTPAPTPVPSLQPSGSCHDWIAQAGVPASQRTAAYNLIMIESGCRVNAYNPSGAYGIPQALPGSKMVSAGADWRTNPVTQIRWMIGYVNSVYGDFNRALAFQQCTGMCTRLSGTIYKSSTWY